jgi:hypothetical protein
VIDLSATVRQVRADMGSADPREIAGKLLAILDPSQYREALEITLPGYVRTCGHTDGWRVRSEVPASTASGRQPGSGPSRADAIRSWYARFLAQSVDPSGVGASWKPLGRCTAVDLVSLARNRRLQASRNIALAEQYEALAEQMRAAEVTAVANLPESTVVEIFGKAAA